MSSDSVKRVYASLDAFPITLFISSHLRHIPDSSFQFVPHLPYLTRYSHHLNSKTVTLRMSKVYLHGSMSLNTDVIKYTITLYNQKKGKRTSGGRTSLRDSKFRFFATRVTAKPPTQHRRQLVCHQKRAAHHYRCPSSSNPESKRRMIPFHSARTFRRQILIKQ